MKTLGNILWFLLTGIESGFVWSFLGLWLCITIIGIPFGKQCFKLARLSFWPIGAQIETDFGAHPIANVIWLFNVGIGLAFGYLFAGVLWCITIIGIPFGKQCFKLAKLAATPFGAEVN